jgi:hypothetical protein
MIIDVLLSHRPVLCAEELLILLVNFMKKNEVGTGSLA